MSYNMKGVLFRNDRKGHEGQPDYKGQCEVDGVEFWLSAWIKEGKNGKFMSLSFTPKDEKKKQRNQQQDDRDSSPF